MTELRVLFYFSADSGSESGSGKKKNTGIIIGITVGAISIVLGLIMFILWKRKSQNIPKRRADKTGNTEVTCIVYSGFGEVMCYFCLI